MSHTSRILMVVEHHLLLLLLLQLLLLEKTLLQVDWHVLLHWSARLARHLGTLR